MAEWRGRSASAESRHSRTVKSQKQASMRWRRLWRNNPMLRRDFIGNLLSAGAAGQMLAVANQAPPASGQAFLERPAEGTPHRGKILLAIQAHSDDIPLSAAGTVAKL